MNSSIMLLSPIFVIFASCSTFEEFDSQDQIVDEVRREDKRTTEWEGLFYIGSDSSFNYYESIIAGKKERGFKTKKTEVTRGKFPRTGDKSKWISIRINSRKTKVNDFYRVVHPDKF